MKHFGKFFSLAALTVVLFIGSAQAAQPDTLVIAPAADVITLNPLKAADSYSNYAIHLLYDPPFINGADLKPQGQLVTKVEMEDDKTFVLTIRDDVKFHDGFPLTAEDVKFTYDFIRDKNNGHRFSRNFDLVDSIEVVSPYVVKFVTSEPYSPLLSYLTLCIAPKHIAEKDKDALDSNPIGSGPYKFVEWKPQEALSLTANENWWVEGEPKIKNVLLRPIAEPTTRLAALETGGIDVADNVPPAQVKGLGAKGLKIIDTPTNGYNLVAFNESKKPFDDKRVREALTLAINRAEITDFVWYGLNKLLNSPIIPNSWAYEPNVKNYGQDVERAKQLLKDAGYPDGFEFEFYCEADENVRKYVEIVQQQWAQVGVKSKIVTKEWGAFFTDITSGKYDVCAWQWVGQHDPDAATYRMFHTNNLAPEGYNWVFYKNDRVNEILFKARTVSDIEERAALYREAQRIVTDDFVYLYLGEYKKFLAAAPRVNNFTYSPYCLLRNITKTTISD
ncbi:ABC transporter substrate-binding protein [Synergistales bacterium]|nr:ABC transporter substrate-binding protein [Synergistales bacterium]